MRLALILIALLIALPARAETLATLWQRGEYQALIDRLTGRQEAGSLALMARAHLALGRFIAPQSDWPRHVRAALAASQAAVAADPDLVEARLQHALALGYRGLQIGPVMAHLNGLAEAARAEIDAALALDAQDPWALAVSGGWHLEIVDRAGPGLAEDLYGATLADGLAAFDRALALDPANPTLHVEFAAALLRHDRRGKAGAARGLLRMARRLTPRNAVEAQAAALACALLAALDSHQDNRIEALLTPTARAPATACAPPSGQ